MAFAGVMKVQVVDATVPPTDRGSKQACVKAELRESADEKQKRKTKMMDIVGNRLAFNETFEFNVNANYDGELRVQLFKKNTGILGGKAVVANAGIFVKQIITHVGNYGDIDKEFNLFTKDGQTAGGNLHLKISFIPANGQALPTTKKAAPAASDSNKKTPPVAEKSRGTLLKVHTISDDEAARVIQTNVRKHLAEKTAKTLAVEKEEAREAAGGFFKKIAVLGVLGGAVFAAVKATQKPPPPPPPPAKKGSLGFR